MLRYAWPGNVRELEKAPLDTHWRSVYAKTSGSRICRPSFRCLPNRPRATSTSAGRYTYSGAPLADVEKDYILSVLQQFDGNQVRAAAALGSIEANFIAA